MGCTYTYKKQTYSSYWKLREALLEDPTQAYRKVTGLLASAATR
jgi:hypothetical protein